MPLTDLLCIQGAFFPQNQAHDCVYKLILVSCGVLKQLPVEIKLFLMYI